jgi:Ser/Thr protein kinase RdoA (MazF antagonist)
MSTLLSAETSDLQAEADWLCSLVVDNAEPLRTAVLKRDVRIQGARFHLHAKDRNTLYRVSGRFHWFLKLTPPGDEAVARERLGADTIAGVLGHRPEYCGAPVVRVGTNPSFVLASAVPGKPLNRVLVTESWIPTAAAAARLEAAFGTLGSLLGTLHATARIGAGAPRATKRPFEALKAASARATSRDAVSLAIAECLVRHQDPDGDRTFVHGNMRLDNVLVSEGRVGFVDLEHCGNASFYQDLSRPVSQLLLTRATIGFPHHRVVSYLGSFLGAYGRAHAYDPRPLADYVFARLGKYCLENRRKMLPSRIGALPIVGSKLDRLALAVLREGVEGAVPELSLRHAYTQ